MTRPSAGFTVIELLVVSGIIALISGLVLVNNNRFGGEVLLQNLAYDIALSIRQAQQFGISVQRFQGGFGAPYGMHFQSSGASAQSVYVLFADAVDENGLYDGGEIVQSTTVSQGYRIVDLCVTPPDSTEVCGLTSLDITFKRPEPDAYIRSAGIGNLNESARIRLTSPRGDQKEVTVEANGQISVQ